MREAIIHTGVMVTVIFFFIIIPYIGAQIEYNQDIRECDTRGDAIAKTNCYETAEGVRGLGVGQAQCGAILLIFIIFAHLPQEEFD